MSDGRRTYDLATQCPSRRSMRRHTIMICEPVPGVAPTVVKLPLEAETPLADACDLATSTNTLGLQLPELSWSRNSLQEDLFHSKQWQHECLSLTLEEIVHIRSVLTKAELESLPVEGRVKEDAERGKVCFLCMKTRFSFFGPRGQQCRLCNRTVCSKCHSKMRIPTEHFSHVPVVAISPSQLASPEDAPDLKSHDAATFSRTLMNRLLQTDSPRSLKHGLNSVGSAPSSPKLQRADTAAASTTAPVTAGHSPATASQPNSGPGSTAESMAESMADSTEGPVSLPALSPDSTSDRRWGEVQSIQDSRTARERAAQGDSDDRLFGLQGHGSANYQVITHNKEQRY
ncbi:Protein spire [Frankliniella fusca]|uniref:Protein spire n=1 Tax=Frankliniella fusca TaxID=407009 RepID=A0AAE1L8R4_9NEOP|nr:Protein spire [Frankliniella fusca]